jgi:hypothetical protein
MQASRLTDILERRIMKGRIHIAIMGSYEVDTDDADQYAQSIATWANLTPMERLMAAAQLDQEVVNSADVGDAISWMDPKSISIKVLATGSDS